MMSTGAGFHANQTGGKVDKERQQHMSAHLFADEHLASVINAVDLKTLFARSRPIVVMFMVDGPPVMKFETTLIMAHQMPLTRAVHIINGS